jgi:hypothetical protein
MQLIQTHSILLKFADDLVLVLEMDDSWSLMAAAEKMKEDLILLEEYYKNNMLRLNLDKSQAMILGNQNMPQVTEILNQFGKALRDEIKYLGVTIDRDLKFDTYFNAIRRNLNQAIGVLCVLRHKLLTSSLFLFYYSHFQSQLIYATFVLLRVNCKDLEQASSIAK